MKNPKRPRSPIAMLVGLAVSVCALSGCLVNPVTGFDPTELAAFNQLHGSNVSSETAKSVCDNVNAQQGPGACVKLVESINASKLTALSRAKLPKLASGNSLSDAQLARLAKCESGGNPTARSKSGTYTGLYQFDRRTWNSVAKRHLPEYVGVLPGNAPPEIQDAMARALHSERGRSPWPVCGRRL